MWPIVIGQFPKETDSEAELGMPQDYGGRHLIETLLGVKAEGRWNWGHLQHKSQLIPWEVLELA